MNNKENPFGNIFIKVITDGSICQRIMRIDLLHITTKDIMENRNNHLETYEFFKSEEDAFKQNYDFNTANFLTSAVSKTIYLKDASPMSYILNRYDITLEDIQAQGLSKSDAVEEIKRFIQLCNIAPEKQCFVYLWTKGDLDKLRKFLGVDITRHLNPRILHSEILKNINKTVFYENNEANVSEFCEYPNHELIDMNMIFHVSKSIFINYMNKEIEEIYCEHDLYKKTYAEKAKTISNNEALPLLLLASTYEYTLLSGDAIGEQIIEAIKKIHHSNYYELHKNISFARVQRGGLKRKL